MKNKWMSGLLVILGMLVLCSCGKKEPKELKASDITEKTLYIKADGSNQVGYIEEFGEEYYNVDELKKFMESELSVYNGKYGVDTAKVSDIKMSDGKVKAVLFFKSGRAYAEFSKKRDDRSIGYPSFDKLLKKFGKTEFYSAEGEKRLGSQAMDREKDHVVLIEGPLLLMTEEEIKFYTKGKLIDENTLRLDDGEQAVVVFSR